MKIKDKHVVEDAAKKEDEHKKAVTSSYDIKADPVDDFKL